MYPDIESIPPHIFSNMACTQSPSIELIQYLRYMHDNHPGSLKYLFERATEYKDHGGYKSSWKRWMKKLGQDLKKQGV